MPKAKRITCKDCYFHQNLLCALKCDKPCPTFRDAERGLAPERQLAFVFRTERTSALYAFPPAGELPDEHAGGRSVRNQLPV